jgi:YD repeat-containing protein
MAELPESEYDGARGPAGVPKRKTERTLTASQKARLERLTGTHDPQAEISRRVWNGQNRHKSDRELEGESWL